MQGIYIVINPINKVYVGESKDVERRFAQYKILTNCKGQTHLFNSFQKHGVENHRFILWHETADAATFERRVYEACYIEFFKCLGFELMNCRSSSLIGGEMSEESRKKMSENQMGRKVSELTRMKLRKANLGKRATDETKAKLSRTHKGSKFPGRVLSESHKLKLSESHKGKNTWSRGRKHSEDTKKKMSEAQKRKKFTEC